MVRADAPGDVVRALVASLVAAAALVALDRRDARDPPFPPQALGALRPLHRACAAVALQVVVGALGVAALVSWRSGESYGGGPMAAIRVAPVLACWCLLDGQPERRSLRGVPWLLALCGGYYAFRFNVQWRVNWAPGPTELDWVYTLVGIATISTPILLAVALRRRGLGILALGASVAILAPAGVRLLEAVVCMFDDRLSPRFKGMPIAAALVLVLPLALRTGDAIGPGEPSDA